MPTVHSELANAYLATGAREQAAKEFGIELEINPLDFDANLGLGLICRENGRPEEAVGLLKKALAARPDEVSALYQMALWQSSNGVTAEAVRLLEQIVKKAPDFSNAHVQLARLYYKLNRIAEAEHESAEIKRLDEEQQKAARQLSEAQLKERAEKQKPTTVTQPDQRAGGSTPKKP